MKLHTLAWAALAASLLSAASCASVPPPPPPPPDIVETDGSEYPLWPGGRVPYVIDASFRGDSLHVEAVMRRWENGTPIRFVPRDGNAVRYVRVTRGGCVTDMHGQNRAVPVSADTSCVGHELGHALGLWHEHQRPDRDRFVTVKTPWYWKYWPKNLAQYESFEQTLCRPYDLGSIMHYNYNKYIKPVSAPITQKDNQPSAGDLLSLRQMYGEAPCTPPVYD